MLSIITAIHNLLPMNRLFLEYLQRYTMLPYELIILDNGSTDGSDRYFKEQGATVMTTGGNYSYPWCQNRGIDAARYDILLFFNNDLLVAPGWDERILSIMEAHKLEIISCCATDRCESDRATRLNQRKWRYVRNPLLFFFGNRYFNLRLMHRLMYGNWERWCAERFERFGEVVQEGIAGSNVIMKRSALDKVGRWDEHIQAADFDLAIRTKLRSETAGDIRPVHIACGVYFHHFVRLTYKRKYPPFTDRADMIRLDQKWDPGEVNPLLAPSGMRMKPRRETSLK
ncbi:MAG: glycosyltransferase family 2 protein [Chitinispirillaceae bacterium]|nr:glycosyltransferase family 2 protein [Chitinispirillaceae bacterium]